MTMLTRWWVLFDGGSLGNPGRGYGSFALRRADEPWSTPVRLEFGDHLTNNEAEYRSLIAALENLIQALEDPTQVDLEILGDSQLVIFQLEGKWRVRAPNLVPLHRAAQRLASRFGQVRYTWQPRARTVRILGH